ncbi:MAG: PKD domain-containing protein [Thermoplasmatota archaeon]
MSKVARSKALGTLMVLSLALAGLLMIPAGISAEGTANMKVRVIEKDFLENIENADVHCVNVHTGEMYDLEWDPARSRYQADVPAGSYDVYASAEGYSRQESPAVVNMITPDNDDAVEIIRLRYIPKDIDLEFRVHEGTEELEGAVIHVFADEERQLSAYTNVSGYAKIRAPQDTDLHILIFYEAMKTVSVNGNWNTSQVWNVSMERPASREDSYKVIGFVKNGTRNIADIDVHIWDGPNGHLVPMEKDFEGALSLPLYDSIFHLLVEAKGYEPLWVPSIDLTTQTYYTPEDEIFEMHKMDTTSSKVTTVHLDSDMTSPVIETIWTMDANSVFWGTENIFGNPRMQISGPFYSNDWLEVDGTEVNDTLNLLGSYGPIRMDTENFMDVNDIYFTSQEEDYSVDITGLSGNVFEEGVNPVVTMTQPYTSEMEYEDGDDLTVEVLNVMDDEVLEIILPDDYEILGDFGDAAEFMNTGRSQLRVFEPLEFNAKVKEAPEAVLELINYYDFYDVDEKAYIVNLDTNVSLSGRNSIDEVGEIEKYHWDLPASAVVWDEDQEIFVDADDLEGMDEMDSITVQFPQDVHYNVTLKVEDTAGVASKTDDWVWITADGTPPTIDDYTMKIKDTGENVTYDEGTNNYTVDEDLEILLNASTAKDGEHGEIVGHIWLFDDGSGALNGEVVTKRFADPGFYNIQLKLQDAVGNEMVVENKTIVVNDVTDPMAVIKPFPDTTQGDEVEMNATQSYDPRTTGNVEEDIVAWTWYVRKQSEDWEDQEEIGDEQVFTYVFEEPGTYVVNLSVEDRSGLTGHLEKVLLVSGPDLQVLSLTFEDPDENNLHDGDRPHLSIAYSNEGTVSVNDTWVLEVLVNGDTVKEETIETELKAGQVSYYNFTYELPKGQDERVFEVVLDRDNDIAEMEEENNNFETTVTVAVEDSPITVWVILVVIAVVLIGYVVYMRFTRQEWGYEPIQRWWENRNK